MMLKFSLMATEWYLSCLEFYSQSITNVLKAQVYTFMSYYLDHY